MTTAARSLSLSLACGKVAALAWGAAKGPPLLALHGWLDNAASFSGLIPRLPEVQGVAPDLPGHGHSDPRPRGTVYHLLDGVGDVLEMADRLGWKRFSLLGHSMGGAIAALAAAAAPERIDRLMLVESLGPLADPAEAAPDRLAQHLKDRGNLTAKRLPLYPDLDTACRARMTAGELSLESARRLADRGTKPVEGGLTWRTDPRLRISSPVRLTEGQVRAFLSRIAAPTLVVRADKGLAPISMGLSERLACLGAGHLAQIPGGHHVHLDHPERVAPLLREFLSL